MYAKLVFSSLILAVVAVYFNSNLKQHFSKTFNVSSSSEVSQKSKIELFTSNELKLYDGINKPQLYLAILGQVYDVSKGVDHYGPQQSYNFFIGKDASRSFITGKFEAGDVSDEVADLSHEDLRSLNYWVRFYGKEYTKVGKLIGRYYNKDGKLTQYGKEVKKLIKDAEKAKEDGDLKKIELPPCNLEWDAERGSHVWCTEKSGGIQRNWVGVPRQLYEPGSQQPQCVCVKKGNENMGNLKEYENCDKDSTSCYIMS